MAPRSCVSEVVEALVWMLVCNTAAVLAGGALYLLLTLFARLAEGR